MLDKLTKYTPVNGTPKIRSAVNYKFKRDQILDHADNKISFGSGAKQFLFNALSVTLDNEKITIDAVDARSATHTETNFSYFFRNYNTACRTTIHH